jgi:hypothetical protein
MLVAIHNSNQRIIAVPIVASLCIWLASYHFLIWYVPFANEYAPRNRAYENAFQFYQIL